MDKLAYKLELTRMICAIVFSLTGIVLSAYLVTYLFSSGMTESKDIAAVVGIFTGITGTLVGTFIGVHMGASGKEQERSEHRKAELMKTLAVSKLTDEQMGDVLKKYEEMSTKP